MLYMSVILDSFLVVDGIWEKGCERQMDNTALKSADGFTQSAFINHSLQFSFRVISSSSLLVF
jgi:hypothetical protein